MVRDVLHSFLFSSSSFFFFLFLFLSSIYRGNEGGEENEFRSRNKNNCAKQLCSREMSI